MNTASVDNTPESSRTGDTLRYIAQGLCLGAQLVLGIALACAQAPCLAQNPKAEIMAPGAAASAAARRAAEAAMKAKAGKAAGGQTAVGEDYGHPITVAPPPPPAPRLLPNLLRTTCAQATEELRALRMGPPDCEPGDWIDGFRPGIVNGQTPDADTRLPLRRAQTVRLSIQPAAKAVSPVTPPVVPSATPDSRVAVPDVRDLPERDAVGRIGASGLRADRVGPPAVSGRRVIGQSVLPPARLGPGSTVELTMGLVVPPLDGLDCDAARARAAAFGHAQFDCEERPADAADQPTGRVIEQSPPPNDSLQPAPVAIRVVVRSAEQVEVPDVRARPLADAVAALGTVRLRARPDAEDGERDIAAQRPAAGSRVAVDTEVQLTTTRAVIVPDVVGARLTDALAMLKSAQLRPKPGSVGSMAARSVVSQDPPAGTRVAARTVVALALREMARVPNLIGRDCKTAHAVIARTGFSLDCADRGSAWHRFFEQPRIARQAPERGTEAPVGTTIDAGLEASTPAAIQWIGTVPPVVAGGGAAASTLLLGMAFWRLRRPTPSPKPVHHPSVVVHWRVEADLAPEVLLRLADAREGASRNGSPALPQWRVVPDDLPHVLVRDPEAAVGDRP